MKEKSKVKISIDHFSPFIEAKAALDKKIKAEGEKAVKSFFKEYFEKRPDVYGVRWTQYTPYFNDGDPCVFSMGAVSVFPTQADFEDDDDDYEFESYGEEPETSLSRAEDILKSVFGDHSRISVTRDSMEVEEYEHD